MPILRTVVKGLDLVEALAASAAPLGTRELARRLGVNATTVHNLVHTLGSRGYLVHDPATRRHRLGPRFLLLGRHNRFNSTLRELAHPVVAGVARRLDASTMLALFLEGHAVRLDSARGATARPGAEPDVLGPMAYATAVGKLMLSTLAAVELEDYLREFPLVAFTPATLTDPARLRREIVATRARGFGQTHCEGAPGIDALAVPIRDPDGRIVAAIGASTPRPAWRGAASRRAVLDDLHGAASRIGSHWFISVARAQH